MARFAPLLLLASLAIAAAAPAAAPEKLQPINFLPAIAGEYFPLASKATGTTYHIYVRYPQGYSESPEQRYPVVYLLDGDSSFPLLAAQHLFLTIDDQLPEAIVVGIAYGSFDPSVNRRDKDFGPGAEAFQRFLSKELIPRVEPGLRADPARRILVGQSFGGAFVLHSALAEPDLFWARIASNPSFRVSGPRLWEAPADASRRDLRLFLVSGTANTPEAREQAGRWVRSRTGAVPWSIEWIDIEGGTHSADLPNAYRAALRKLFARSGQEAPKQDH